jgi:hypothetical protein
MNTKKGLSTDDYFYQIVFNVVLIIVASYILTSDNTNKLVFISIILFFWSYISIKSGYVGIGYYMSIECYKDEDPKVFWTIVAGQIILGVILLFIQYL